MLPTGEIAAKTAKELHFPHRTVSLDREILEKAYELLLRDGFPRSAINYIHGRAVETLALDPAVKLIADGTRRDDRVPVLSISQIRSIEDRMGVQYFCPLKGYGKKVVDSLVRSYLNIEQGPSESTQKADYETELRELIRQRQGDERIRELFPVHFQSCTFKEEIS